MTFLFIFVYLKIYTDGFFFFFKDFTFQQLSCCLPVLRVGSRGLEDFSQHLFSPLLCLHSRGSLLSHPVPPPRAESWCLLLGAVLLVRTGKFWITFPSLSFFKIILILFIYLFLVTFMA